VQYGHPEFLQGRGAQLLSLTATASLIASFIGLFIFYLATKNTDFLSFFLNNTPRLVMLLAIIASIVFSSTAKIKALAAVFLGVVAGHVGFSPVTGTYFLSSQNFLAAGIPLVPLFLGFLVIPELVNYMKARPENIAFNSVHLGLFARISNLVKLNGFSSMLRGSFVGAIAGLIPGVGTSISSLLAANLESKIHKTPRDYVLAAEAANNSAATTVLIPFILLALPIVPSEAIVMSIAERNGFGISTSFSILATLATPLIGTLIAANIINWAIAGMFYNTLAQIYFSLRSSIYYVITIVCVSIVIYVGIINNQFQLSLITGAIGVIFGLLIQNMSIRLAFVFAFFLSTPLISELYRFFLFHF
jgi:putative tricarboxylic transport membrane protein